MLGFRAAPVRGCPALQGLDDIGGDVAYEELGHAFHQGSDIR